MKLPNIFEKTDNLQSYRAGDIILEEGARGDAMYVVKDGEIEIVAAGRVMETVGPEGFFGEMALVDSEPRSASARAKTDCTLVPITERQFLFMVSETPFFALNVMRGLAQRLRRKQS